MLELHGKHAKMSGKAMQIIKDSVKRQQENKISVKLKRNESQPDKISLFSKNSPHQRFNSQVKFSGGTLSAYNDQSPQSNKKHQT